MASKSKGSEFLNSVMNNVAPPPQDTAQIPGDQMSKTVADMKARMDASSAARKSPRLLSTPKHSTGPDSSKPNFPLLSENERKAP